MKPNTSKNDEHDLPFETKFSWSREEVSRLTAHWRETGFSQGYAKALKKIKEMIKARYTELEILEYISKEELK